MNYFKDILKELRITTKTPQKTLAETLGVKLRTYQSYEYGEREPDIDGLIALADFFNVSLDELVGRTNLLHK